MKKLLVIVAAMVLVLALSACKPEEAATYEIALVTDIGTIDDGSFNQGAWDGVEKYALENDVTHKFYQPLAKTTDDYVDAIDWEVIFFLIAMFAIVEILNEAKIFHTVAKAIVKKFS